MRRARRVASMAWQQIIVTQTLVTKSGIVCVVGVAGRG